MPQLLDAIVKAYEVAIKVGLVAASNGNSPWYNSLTCEVYGAGMAASSLLGLSRSETLDSSRIELLAQGAGNGSEWIVL